MSASAVSVDPVPLDDLLRVALSRPDAAEAAATDLISSSVDPAVLSVAHQALGLVLRDRGEIEAALVQLRSALRSSQRTKDPDREADVRASLGAALTMAGRTRAGLAQLDRASERAADPGMRAKVLMRRGYVLTLILGRHREAVAALRSALSGIRLTQDRVWEARTRNLLGVAHLALGEVSTASSLVLEASRIFVEEGQQVEALQTMQMQGLIAFCRGDLPDALALYARAAERFAALGPTPPLLAVDQAEALLSAGLVRDAIDVLREHLERAALQAVRRSELLLALAAAELATGQAEESLRSATAARSLFRRQRREQGVQLAELAVLQARERLGARGARLVGQATIVARRLADAGSDEAPTGWLVAGRLALRSGDPSAEELLTEASRARRHPSSLVRATGWLAAGVRAPRRRPRSVVGLPSRARRHRRASGDPGQHGAAGVLGRARRRARPSGRPPRREGQRSQAAVVGRAVARQRSRSTAGASAGQSGVRSHGRGAA